MQFLGFWLCIASKKMSRQLDDQTELLVTALEGNHQEVVESMALVRRFQGTWESFDRLGLHRFGGGFWNGL